MDRVPGPRRDSAARSAYTYAHRILPRRRVRAGERASFLRCAKAEHLDASALAAYIDSSMNEQELISSAFLETELRRLAIRLEFDQSVVTDLLARVDLV